MGSDPSHSTTAILLGIPLKHKGTMSKGHHCPLLNPRLSVPSTVPPATICLVRYRQDQAQCDHHHLGKDQQVLGGVALPSGGQI
jgi:hypothetical protein